MRRYAFRCLGINERDRLYHLRSHEKSGEAATVASEGFGKARSFCFQVRNKGATRTATMATSIFA